MSRALADIVEKVGASVVRVDDGSRLTATGIVWASEAGVILTTSHGVERDEDLSVVAGNGTRYAATLAGRDPDSDLAVLRIDGGAWAAAPLPAAERAPGDAARVGNLVLALARPGAAGCRRRWGS
jgi:S1-C subfamily serine protease